MMKPHCFCKPLNPCKEKFRNIDDEKVINGPDYAGNGHGLLAPGDHGIESAAAAWMHEIPNADAAQESYDDWWQQLWAYDWSSFPDSWWVETDPSSWEEAENQVDPNKAAIDLSFPESWWDDPVESSWWEESEIQVDPKNPDDFELEVEQAMAEHLEPAQEDCIVPFKTACFKSNSGIYYSSVNINSLMVLFILN